MSLRTSLAACVATTLFTCAVSSAAPVYSGPVNLPIPNTFDGLFLNVLTGSTYTGPGFPTTTGPGANYDFNLYVSASTWTFFAPGFAGQDPSGVTNAQRGYVSSATSGPVIPVALGSSIGPASLFSTSTVVGSSGFAGAGEQFVGFRFRAEPGLTTHYGWALIDLPATTGNAGTLISYGYESTPDTAISAGAGIPEPATLTALAGAGLIALRRRRA